MAWSEETNINAVNNNKQNYSAIFTNINVDEF